MTTKENLKADMWCHFGKAVIRGPDKGNIACESCNLLSDPSGEKLWLILKLVSLLFVSSLNTPALWVDFHFRAISSRERT